MVTRTSTLTTLHNSLFNEINDMLQLVLESKNERNLLLIRELAEKLSIHCRFILPKDDSELSKHYEIGEAIRSWQEYADTGLHVTSSEVIEWLDTWGMDAEKAAPLCHK